MQKAKTIKIELFKKESFMSDTHLKYVYAQLKGQNDNTIPYLTDYLKKNYAPHINVRIELNENMGYAPVTKLRLSSHKLMALGWHPRYGLKEMFERLIKYLNN